MRKWRERSKKKNRRIIKQRRLIEKSGLVEKCRSIPLGLGIKDESACGCFDSDYVYCEGDNFDKLLVIACGAPCYMDSDDRKTTVLVHYEGNLVLYAHDKEVLKYVPGYWRKIIDRLYKKTKRLSERRINVLGVLKMQKEQTL